MLLPEKYESIFDVSSKGPSSGSLVNKGMLLPEKYESIFDVSSEGPSSGSLVNKSLFTKLPDEGPLLETSKILSYFSGRSIPNLLRRYLRSLYLHWQLLSIQYAKTGFRAICIIICDLHFFEFVKLICFQSYTAITLVFHISEDGSKIELIHCVFSKTSIKSWRKYFVHLNWIRLATNPR